MRNQYVCKKISLLKYSCKTLVNYNIKSGIH